MRAQLQFQFNQFPENLAKVLLNLFRTKALCDVRLIGEDDIPVEAHKVILAAFSEVLKRIIQKENGKSSEIQLHGMNHHDIENIVQFMYLGQASVAHADVDKFLRTAKFLGISQLSDQCKTDVENINEEFYIGENIDESEVNYGIIINEDFGEIVRESGIRETEDRIISNEGFEEINIDEPYEDTELSEGKYLEVRNDPMASTVNRDYMNCEKEGMPDFILDEEDINKVTIGRTVENFSVSSSVLFSHNFFRKVCDNNGIRQALCLMCWKEEKNTKTFKLNEGGNYYGLRNHMITYHHDFEEEYLRLRQRVDELKSLRRESMLKENFDFEVDAILEDKFIVGEPTTPKFNITESVCFSHNYFKRLGSGNIALCLMCLRSKDKSRVFLSIPSNSCKGLMCHLASKHSEYTKQFSSQREAVQDLRIERRKERELFKAQRKKNKLKVDIGEEVKESDHFNEDNNDHDSKVTGIADGEDDFGIRIKDDCEEIVKESDNANGTSNKGFENQYEQNKDTEFSNTSTVQGKYLEDVSNDQMASTVKKKTQKRKYVRKFRREIANFKLDEEDINKVTVGKSLENFSVFSSVLFSHNFFRKVYDNNGIRKALCLMCWKKEKSKMMIKINNDKRVGVSYKGLRNHMMACHHDFEEEYLRLRRRIDELKSLERDKRRAFYKSLQRKGEKSNQSMLKENFDFEVDAILEDNFMIGEPTTLKFSITESVCFSHNYFRKLSSGVNALCLMCLRSKENKRVILAFQSNSCKGLLIHLSSKHSEYSKQFSLQRAAIQDLRIERRKTNELFKIQRKRKLKVEF